MRSPIGTRRDESGAVQNGVACTVPLARKQIENRGLAWVMGAFLICPCHLPLTLGLAAALLSGTAAGVVLRDHPYVAGTVMGVVWLAATWRGIGHLRSARRYADAVMRPGQRSRNHG